MIRRYIAFVALAVVPSLTLAQRGSGTKTQSTEKTDLFKGADAAPVGPSLRVRDLEDESPLKLLIDKHKDLKLTDAQIAQLKSSENVAQGQERAAAQDSRLAHPCAHSPGT